jgi:hypothetical protein
MVNLAEKQQKILMPVASPYFVTFFQYVAWRKPGMRCKIQVLTFSIA